MSPAPAPPSKPPVPAADRTSVADEPVLQMPPTVRVGLATDLDHVVFDCCRHPLELIEDPWGRATPLPPPSGRIEIRPQLLAESRSYRIQVGASKDENLAYALAATVVKETRLKVDVVFDSGTDLYRVRIGHFEDEAEAGSGIERLAALGLEDVRLVEEAVDAGGVRLSVRTAEGEKTIDGRWLAVEGEGDGIDIGRRHFRGRALVYLSDRGLLNLVNEVRLDDYLRGVLPREMGPELYPAPEALKAQAIAARSYLLSHLDDFRAEGYEICATPRCQVYGGTAAEHPMSDEAIEATAGQVLVYRGRPALALYSASCGGHTEDVSVVFPERQAPYLRGVACVQGGVSKLRAAHPPARLPQPLLHHLLPEGVDELEKGGLETALRRLSGLAALRPAEKSLQSLERAAVRRFVLSQFDLKLDRWWFEGNRDGGHRREELEPAQRDLAAFFDRGEAELSHDEIEELLFYIAVVSGGLRYRELHFLSLGEDRIRLKQTEPARHQLYRLSEELATFRRSEGGLRRADLELLPGDPLGVLVVGDTVLTVVEEAPRHPVAGAAGDWSRYRSHEQLARLVGRWHPGFVPMSLEVVDRGISGRVGHLRLVSAEGEELLLAGLAIRWALDLPETLFSFSEVERGDTTGWLFEGRGRGHGVGLCQIGSFEMAQRGSSYREILEHYYFGLDLVHFEESPATRRDRDSDGPGSTASSIAMVDAGR